MSLKKELSKSMWNKLSFSDKVAIAWIFVRKGKASALVEITKRVTQNTFSR